MTIENNKKNPCKRHDKTQPQVPAEFFPFGKKTGKERGQHGRGCKQQSHIRRKRMLQCIVFSQKIERSAKKAGEIPDMRRGVRDRPAHTDKT